MVPPNVRSVNHQRLTISCPAPALAAPYRMTPPPRPPETLEGWFVLHQVARLHGRHWRALTTAARTDTLASARATLDAMATVDGGGWSATVPLVGSTSDILCIHIRPSLAQLFAVQGILSREPLWDYLTPTFSFLSVTEAALYALSVKLEETTRERGGTIGDATYQDELARRLAAERDSPHLQRRLFPERPADMPYVSFYPMSKRRLTPHNWYTLPMAERDRLMREHGLTGRRYGGRIRQVVSGAIGFEQWEWGVTLFAKDPLDLKHIVTDMRHEAASADYAEFGEFFVGRKCEPAEWLATLER